MCSDRSSASKAFLEILCFFPLMVKAEYFYRAVLINKILYFWKTHLQVEPF
jgi:hypothetical protein